MREALSTIIAAARRIARQCADERGVGTTEYVALAVGGLVVAGAVVAVLTMWANKTLTPMTGR